MSQLKNSCYRTYLIFNILIIFFLTILGCAPKTVKLTVLGTPKLNSGGNTVILRIYQLRGDANFQRATIESFWQTENSDGELLGSELIEKFEIILHPDEERIEEIKIAEDAKFLGVAANFHDPDKEKWSQLVSMDSYKGQEATLVLGEKSLAITAKKIEKNKTKH